MLYQITDIAHTMKTFTPLTQIDPESQDYKDLLKAQQDWVEFNQETRSIQNSTRSFDDSIRDRDSAGRRAKRIAKKLDLNPVAWGTAQHWLV